MASREKTIIDHKERLNKVLVYIQGNIDRPLLLGTLAEIACFSPFHFHRIFAAYVRETISEHIRRIRLERAAFKLSNTDEPITSIALSAGYETPSAFSKAFRLNFGKSPSDFRDSKSRSLTSKTNLLDLNVSTKEGKIMKPEIRVFPDQKVLFVRKTGRYDKAASEAWSTLMQFAYSHRLMKKDTKMIVISHDSPDITSEENLRYDACITISEDIKPEGEVGIQTICGKYAVFLHKGPYDGLGETYNVVFSQWLPSSGEKLRDDPCFEIYLNRDPRRTKPENLKTEIYIPIE